MAVGKLMFAAGLAMSLGLASVANARTGELESLAIEPVEKMTPEMLWAGMEAEVDTLWGELAPEVEKQRNYYFAPTGPADRQWADRGVDLGALLARSPGGDTANVLYSDEPEGPVVQALNAEGVAGLANAWAVVAERRFASRGGAVFVNMLAITPAHLLVSEEAWERVGNGYCPKSQTPAPADHIAVYRDSLVPFDAASDLSDRSEGAAFSMWTALSRTPTPRICWIYVEVSPGRYETRSFDAEGRPLGHMDENTRRLRIVPVVDLRTMLTARMEPRKSPDSASAQ